MALCVCVCVCVCVRGSSYCKFVLVYELQLVCLNSKCDDHYTLCGGGQLTCRRSARSLTSSVLGQSKFQPHIWSLPVNMFIDIMQMVRVTVPTITSQGWEEQNRPWARNNRDNMLDLTLQEDKKD